MSLDHNNDPRASAVERLAVTRARMRMSLQESIDPRPSGDDKPSVLMTALMAIPGANIVIESVRNWWSQHPLHLVTLLASSTARSAVRPIARNNPYSLIIAAMAIGGLLFWVKPWRGLLKPALLAGLVPHLVSRAMAHVPMESWFSALMAMVTDRKPATSSSSPDPAGATAASQPTPPGAQSAQRPQTEARPAAATVTAPDSPAGPLH